MTGRKVLVAIDCSSPHAWLELEHTTLLEAPARLPHPHPHLHPSIFHSPEDSSEGRSPLLDRPQRASVTNARR